MKIVLSNVDVYMMFDMANCNECILLITFWFQQSVKDIMVKSGLMWL